MNAWYLSFALLLIGSLAFSGIGEAGSFHGNLLVGFVGVLAVVLAVIVGFSA